MQFGRFQAASFLTDNVTPPSAHEKAEAQAALKVAIKKHQTRDREKAAACAAALAPKR